MDPHEIIERISSFGSENPIIALIIGLVFFFMLYRNPKGTLSLLVLILVAALVYSLIIEMSSSGKSEKKKLINQSEGSSSVDKE